MEVVKPKQGQRVFHNTKELSYIEAGIKKLTIASKPIFKSSGWERCNENTKKILEFLSKPKNMDNEVRSDSILRAKRTVYDIALLNYFKYFVTWTLNGEKIERTNAKEVSKKLKIFLSNIVQRNNASYLLVPEYHKDNEGIHMHALLNGDFDLIDSGKRTNDGKTIYNMNNWTLGFSTAIGITGDRVNVAKYITKYISKDFRKIFGKFYYAGGNIIRKPQANFYDLEYGDIQEKEYHVPVANISFKYLNIEGVNT